MLCSGLYFVDPVLARVFAHWTPGLPQLVDYGSVLSSLLAFAVLARADRHAVRGRWVFAGFGALSLAMHTAALGIEHWSPWRRAMQGWFG